VGLPLVRVRLAVHDLVPPDVAALDPLDVLPRPAYDEGVPDRRALRDRLVDGGLERAGAPPAVAAVGGDDHARLASSMRLLSASEEKPPNTSVWRGTESCAGEHRHDGLGDHRHVDGDPVTGLHAQLGEGVGRPVHLALEIGVR
jgi:hypothetical protein